MNLLRAATPSFPKAAGGSAGAHAEEPTSMTAATMNIWDVYWGLRVDQCPCDVHFVEWLEEEGLTGKRIYHLARAGTFMSAFAAPSRN